MTQYSKPIDGHGKEHQRDEKRVEKGKYNTGRIMDTTCLFVKYVTKSRRNMFMVLIKQI